MDTAFNNVKDLNQWRSNWHVRVLVYKSWKSQSEGESEVLNFIFADENGDKIHGICDDIQNIDYYQRNLIEGDWKTIQDFTVFECDRNNRVVDNQWKIRLLDNTDVKILEDMSGEHYGSVNSVLKYVSFTSFDDVIAGRFNRDLPIDVIGRIASISDIVKVKDSDFGEDCPANTCRLDFSLENNLGMNLSCVAHGKIAIEINKKWWTWKTKKIVCVLSDWRVRRIGATIQLIECGDVSRFYFDPDISVARRFTRVMNGIDEGDSA